MDTVTSLYKPCNSCGETRYHRIRPYPGFEGVDLVRCETCRLMQAQPTPTDEFLWQYYRTTFGNNPSTGFEMPQKAEWGFRLRALLQFDFIKKILGSDLFARGKKPRILDVGCHAASFLYLFKMRGWEVVGLDPNPRSRYGLTWYGIPVIQKLFGKGFFEPESFDAILHSHALEHVPDPKGYLEEFYRILKPGGWVFIEVPNESLEKVSTQKVIPHLYFFSPDTLRDLGQSAGFKVAALRVLGIGPRKGPLFSKEGLQWLKLRWQARFDALGRLDLWTLLPFFGRIFKEDRYFRDLDPHAAMLRAFLIKDSGLSPQGHS